MDEAGGNDEASVRPDGVDEAVDFGTFFEKVLFVAGVVRDGWPRRGVEEGDIPVGFGKAGGEIGAEATEGLTDIGEGVAKGGAIPWISDTAEDFIGGVVAARDEDGAADGREDSHTLGLRESRGVRGGRQVCRRDRRRESNRGRGRRSWRGGWSGAQSRGQGGKREGRVGAVRRGGIVEGWGKVPRGKRGRRV